MGSDLSFIWKIPFNAKGHHAEGWPFAFWYWNCLKTRVKYKYIFMDICTFFRCKYALPILQFMLVMIVCTVRSYRTLRLPATKKEVTCLPRSLCCRFWCATASCRCGETTCTATAISPQISSSTFCVVMSTFCSCAHLPSGAWSGKKRKRTSFCQNNPPSPGLLPP